jgi:hypothetical protein
MDMGRRVMKLTDIKIKDSFANSTPSELKMRNCRKHWEKFGKQDRDIVVNQNGYLIDGYIQYLILQEFGIEETDTLIVNSKDYAKSHFVNNRKHRVDNYRTVRTIYITGHHPKTDANLQYTWRIPAGWSEFAKNIEIGDMIFCNTKHGSAPVIVDRVDVYDICPVNRKVRKVSCKIIKKTKNSNVSKVAVGG